MNYNYIYKDKETGRKVFSRIPLNYQKLELVSSIKRGVIDNDDTSVLRKKYKRKVKK
jgi:hypothetical protein